MEFALVLPILTLFLFGIVQFGIAYDRQQSINSSAREGARIGALPSSTLEEISTRAVDAYGASAAAGEEITVVVRDDGGSEVGRLVRDDSGSESYTPSSAGPSAMPCGSDPPSDFLEVVVTTPYELTIPFFGVQLLNIDSKAQFRCE